MCGKRIVQKKEIKALLLGVVALCTRMRTSTRTGHMLWINCPIFKLYSVTCLVQKPSPLSPPIHTRKHLTDNDNINMLGSSSVGHNIVSIILTLLRHRASSG
jgi:hypothetical protein